eukprot:SAG31_NODE_5762_length_2340_cov_1.163592_1_plen_175_part_00
MTKRQAVNFLTDVLGSCIWCRWMSSNFNFSARLSRSASLSSGDAAARGPEASLQLNIVLFVIRCLSPLNAADAAFQATLWVKVPFSPQVAPGELTRSNRNDLTARSELLCYFACFYISVLSMHMCQCDQNELTSCVMRPVSTDQNAILRLDMHMDACTIHCRALSWLPSESLLI